MHRMIRNVALALATAVVANSSLAISAHDLAAQSSPSQMVKERKALMKSMGGGFGPVIAVIKGRTTDLTDAAAAAEAVSGEAKRIVALFPAGTGRDAVPESRAKPEVWSRRAEFEAAAGRLAAETAKLAAAGKSNDLAAFKAQFRPVAKSCGGCHSGKSSKGGKFRFPEG